MFKNESHLSKIYIKLSVSFTLFDFSFLVYQLTCALIDWFIVSTIVIYSTFIINSHYLIKFNFCFNFIIIVSFTDILIPKRGSFDSNFKQGTFE